MNLVVKLVFVFVLRSSCSPVSFISRGVCNVSDSVFLRSVIRRL
jgi:hypothetical protein